MDRWVFLRNRSRGFHEQSICFLQNVPLVNSVDGVPPAPFRFLECKLGDLFGCASCNLSNPDCYVIAQSILEAAVHPLRRLPNADEIHLTERRDVTLERLHGPHVRIQFVSLANANGDASGRARSPRRRGGALEAGIDRIQYLPGLLRHESRTAMTFPPLQSRITLDELSLRSAGM